jgi:hypothetical protein
MIKDATAWLASVVAAGSLGFAGCAIIAGLDNTYENDAGAGGGGASDGAGGGGGAGGSTSCTDSSACNDLNACTIDMCDTAVGTCVSTQAPDGPLPGGPNPCSTQTCMGGSLVNGFAPANTSCGAILVCDGMGNCVGCTKPEQCPAAPECQSHTCAQNVCGVQNVSAGSACQGGICNGMGACVECLVNSDCTGAGTPVCKNGMCVDACADGVMNGNETDVDCGGNECPECAAGKICDSDDDCSSNDCSGGLCISCMDGVLNGTESDVDCGGTCQANCANGKMCNSNGDCLSNSCMAGTCK